MGSDHKAISVFRHTSVRPTFEADVMRLREKYKVPLGGFSTAQESEDWHKKKDDELRTFLIGKKIKKRIFEEYGDDLLAILHKHKLRPTLFSVLSEYLASDKIEPKNYYHYTCEIDTSGGVLRHFNENRWSDSGVKFVKLLISEDATPTEVKRYIGDHWKEIRILMQAAEAEPPRMKRSDDWERDQIVFYLSRLKKKGLEAKLRQFDKTFVSGTKGQIIGRFMPKYEYKKLSGEAVAQIIKRQQRLRKEDI